MRISGSVAQWEDWTKQVFPENGMYVVPGALVLVEIDRERDEGVYVEPKRLDAPQGLARQAHELA